MIINFSEILKHEIKSLELDVRSKEGKVVLCLSGKDEEGKVYNYAIGILKSSIKEDLNITFKAEDEIGN